MPKNTDFKKLDSIRLHQEPFLHDGYILVELELQVYKNGELLLSYQTESKSPSSIPYQPSYGDTIFYDSERRASQMLN
ncbi:hypothetical protein EII17_14780 [Clostridiales bacterium COT073_COT-073]|nr:hypothetical protein EII17_14780 [Clostridiales bacterium COT073_COT-073]